MDERDLHTCPNCGFAWSHYEVLCRRGRIGCRVNDQCADCREGHPLEDSPWGEQQGQIDWMERDV